MSHRGKYIVIEGNDGTGKSTQVARLEQRLLSLSIECSQIHEPDGVPTASRLRDIIKDGRLERDPWTNVLLFTAARRLNWFQDMQPYLAEGKYVLAARNWYSTAIYQGYGQGEDVDKIEQFTLDNISSEYLQPDLTIVLVMHEDSARTDRISKREILERPDTFESMPDDFQKRVNEGYIHFAAKRGIETIDASRSIEEVEADIWTRVQKVMEA